MTASGFKSWRWKYRFAGKEKRLTFGAYPEVTLAAARVKRDDAASLLREGTDPAIDRKQRKAALVVESANTFETIARSWHETQAPRWTATHAADVLTSLENDVFPVIGKLPITSITAPMVLNIIRAIEARPAIETARRVRQRMSAVFVFAIASGIPSLDQDPAAVVKGALKPLKKGRQPAFRDLDPARELLRKVEAEPAHPVTKLASRLLALTIVRPGVLRHAAPEEFEDLDGEEPLWRIPAGKMKLLADLKEDAAFEFLVPLSTQAVDVVRVALRLAGNGPFLFPGTRHAHRPMSENAIGYMYNRTNFRGRHVPHGWRATFSTVMNEIAEREGRPEDRPIIDLMLAHKPEGVEGIYNRAAYMPRRREIAQAWSDMLLEGFAAAEELLIGPRR